MCQEKNAVVNSYMLDNPTHAREKNYGNSNGAPLHDKNLYKTKQLDRDVQKALK